MEGILKQLVEMMQGIETRLLKSQEELMTRLRKRQEDLTTKWIKSQEDLNTEYKKRNEDMIKFLKNMNSQEPMKNSQETTKGELKTKGEKKVHVVAETGYIIKESTSPKNEIKKDVKMIENEAENKHGELKIGNEGTDGAKASGMTDSNVDATTDNVQQRPESNGVAKEGEP